ncbi:MAG: pyridoxal phosphate-dependent aminotransferase family protein [Clostridia bacterium]
MDLFDFSGVDYIYDLIDCGLYPYFNALETAQDTEVVINGKNTIMLGSNNYMGLTNDPRTIKAAHQALDKYGTGCSGSRFLNGTLVLHQELEAELADFFGKEEAVTFSTGFQTNLGIISALATRHTYIIGDAENHASLVDASRLSFAKNLIKYEHSDMADLEDKLGRLPAEAPKLIVTDGVFSMSGDIAKIPEIVELKKKYGARLMIDDAHGVGMIGNCGRGTANYYGLTDNVDIIMTTFSKSLASLGGCMVANKDVAFFVRHKSRPFIFSASIPPSNAACALEALRIMKNEPDRQKNLINIANYMRGELRKNNIPIMDGETAIIPVYTYSVERTLIAAKHLLNEGVYVNPVLPPATPENQCLLRTSYTATHTKSEMDRAVLAFVKVFSELG